MLLEDLLALPVGTRVLGEIEVPTTVHGIIGAFEDGSHFIRWDDGYSTIPLGKVREYDEYIAAHTEPQSTRCLRVDSKEDEHRERTEERARGHAARVRRT